MEAIKIEYLRDSLRTYLDRLASGDPVPGGGSAAALALSLAAGLLSMTANFTIGKKRLAAFEAGAKRILEKTESVRRKAAELVEEDSRVYLQYRQAAALEKTSPNRSEALKQAVRESNRLLLEIAGLTKQLLPEAELLRQKGNPYLLSDVACATSLLKAAFESAEINVLINLSGQPDLPEAAETKSILKATREAAMAEAEYILSEIRRKLSNP